jgi:transposase
MVRDNRHVSTYIFGAICPRPRPRPARARATSAAMIMPYATTEAMNKHLVEISAEVAPEAHAVPVCDGAGWHQRGKKLVVPDNISLLTLPPYSPELNPMENVWAYLRQNKLCALVWPTYGDILDACQSAWRFLINEPDRIRSIGTRQWACVTV